MALINKGIEAKLTNSKEKSINEFSIKIIKIQSCSFI